MDFLENFIEKNNLSDYHVKEISQQNRDDSEKKKKLLKKLKDTLEKYYELKKNKARKLKKTDDDYFLIKPLALTFGHSICRNCIPYGHIEGIKCKICYLVSNQDLNEP